LADILEEPGRVVQAHRWHGGRDLTKVLGSNRVSQADDTRRPVCEASLHQDLADLLARSCVGSELIGPGCQLRLTETDHWR
jgi:hypothetical protein